MSRQKWGRWGGRAREEGGTTAFDFQFFTERERERLEEREGERGVVMKESIESVRERERVRGVEESKRTLKERKGRSCRNPSFFVFNQKRQRRTRQERVANRKCMRVRVKGREAEREREGLISGACSPTNPHGTSLSLSLPSSLFPLFPHGTALLLFLSLCLALCRSITFGGAQKSGGDGEEKGKASHDDDGDERQPKGRRTGKLLCLKGCLCEK
jgi:hypothetical protein